ncbi:HAD-IIIA family hydrolase [Roseiarcaceae bacterium H3SJ34-1]|uniref:HAD-IIIA family hydrolase n=1 Tax=Terripilifer ovatus TaxID=3032367 RepID=UPI003AB9AE70|nr:HAD-IIIA family hydrolase [Roseiarcaceae bacterium H3SJ34-1]
MTSPPLNAQVAILCGGLGTRLGALTASVPKPLLPVGDMPFLDHLLFEVARFGFRDILLLAHFQSEAVQRFAEISSARAAFDLNLRVCIEPQRAGTGGALYHAQNLLADEFILMNGDTWLGANYHALLAHRAATNTVAAMALREVAEPDRYNVVDFDGRLIRNFRRSRVSTETGFINGGVAACSAKIFQYLSPKGSLEDEVWPILAEQGLLAGLSTPGFFLDIGIPAAFESAQIDIPAQHRRGAVFFDRDGVLNADHGHVGTVDRLEWLKDAERAVRLANDANRYAFVVTNQAGVAKGYYTEGDVNALHAHMQAHLNANGAHIDAFRYCPYHVDGTVAEYARESDHRKPKPGMILDLLQKWQVDPMQSVLIGDKDSDLAAAEAAGIRGAKFEGGSLYEFLRAVI